MITFIVYSNIWGLKMNCLCDFILLGVLFMNGWKELYDKKKRPGINELSAYLPADVMVLFSEY